jgi:diaminopimelate epimerase
MKIIFAKYHGTGNDFIMIDNRELKWEPTGLQVAHLCSRHFGIGADGLILLTKQEDYDFGMIYYNSDGNESSMCGNGGRCIVSFANSIGIIENEAYFIASDGKHRSEIVEKSNRITQVRLNMKDVLHVEYMDEDFFIDSGSPHYIVLKENIDEMDIVTEARKIRYNQFFAKEGGTNVNFVEIKEDFIYVRSYERGVEDETLSCGTGITASAIAAALRTNNTKGHYKIKSLGGELSVDFHRQHEHFTNIWLEGPAEFVFKGEVTI